MQGLAAAFLLDGLAVRPQAKPEAFYAFTGLDAGARHLRVEVGAFFPFEGVMPVPMATPLSDGIMACRLEPGPAYPYPDWDGVVRGQVRRHGRPLAGVDVSGSYQGRGARCVTRQTRTWGGGPYDGRYALSFGCRLPANTAVSLEFVAPGGTGTCRQVSLSPGVQVFLDVDLN